MLRRLFFLFPDTGNANQAVNELAVAGVDIHHIHTTSKHEPTIAPLPTTTPKMQRDTRWALERVLWYGNMTLFVAAFVAFGVTLIWGLWLESLLSLAFVYLTGIAGARFRFISSMPNVHRDDFHNELEHGEVLLMVDVPSKNVPEVENILQHSHPEATEADAAWTLEPRGT